MSVARDGAIVARRVIGWYRSPLADRAVYRMSYASSAIRGGKRAITWLTGDHEVLTRRGWVRADGLNPADEIAMGQGLSRVAREVAIGSLLGDGGIRRSSAMLAFVHGRDQAEYVRLKARALAELAPIVDEAEVTNQLEGRRYLVSRCRTRSTRALRVLRRRFYGPHGKQIPRVIVLTPRIAAIWFLDDGYTKIKSPNLGLSEIAAHSFSAEDIRFLIERLKGDLDVEAYTRESSPGRIHFGSEASRRLSEIVAPYCPPCLRYKLHPDPERRITFDPSSYDPDQRETLFDQVIIERVENFDGMDETFFCIDVEDTHNFVTSGGVVHNCRPPGNRNPEPDEVAACEPFLRKQLEALAPRLIVALGKFAAQTLARTDAPISALRGRWHSYQGIRLMPTFHPAFLLRSPDRKRDAWHDLQLVMAEMKRLGLGPKEAP
ncbi:MAG TPA: uracil-DNA glycosylase family protein [Polyangia bacterium]|nr:uracil-DNA glycosylase family protein [Polyangia bacterium]